MLRKVNASYTESSFYSRQIYMWIIQHITLENYFTYRFCFTSYLDEFDSFFSHLSFVCLSHHICYFFLVIFLYDGIASWAWNFAGEIVYKNTDWLLMAFNVIKKSSMVNVKKWHLITATNWPAFITPINCYKLLDIGLPKNVSVSGVFLFCLLFFLVNINCS